MTVGAARVESRDWETYAILTFGQIPEIEVELIDPPGSPYLGAGEAAEGPSAAALANAVFDASRRRARSVPIDAGLRY